MLFADFYTLLNTASRLILTQNPSVSSYLLTQFITRLSYIAPRCFLSKRHISPSELYQHLRFLPSLTIAQPARLSLYFCSIWLISAN